MPPMGNTCCELERARLGFLWEPADGGAAGSLDPGVHESCSSTYICRFLAVGGNSLPSLVKTVDHWQRCYIVTKMKAHHALLHFACAAICSSLCRADVDPDAAAATRIPPRISPEVLNGTGSIMPPDPIQTLGCTGGTALVFSLDVSNSIVEVEFGVMLREVRLPWQAPCWNQS